MGVREGLRVHVRRDARDDGRVLIAVRAPTVALLLAAALLAACVPRPPMPSPSPSTASDTPPPVAAPATDPGDWVRHDVPEAGISLALPPDWRAYGEADLTEPGRRNALERDFAGAGALFGRLEAQGRQARVVFLAVDGRARGTGRIAPAVTIVLVEPAVPALLLGIGADFAIRALRGALAIEGNVERERLRTPIGPAVRIGFDHRVVLEAGSQGVLVEHDGALVTTGDTTVLVSRTVDPARPAGGVPTLDEVVATLREAG